LVSLTRICGWNFQTRKDKLSAFVEQYWHFDLITKKSEKQFIDSYVKWAKKRGYRNNQAKASEIYALAKNSIPILTSESPTTKLMVQNAVKVLREVDETLASILTQMQEVAMSLREYAVVREMKRVS